MIDFVILNTKSNEIPDFRFASSGMTDGKRVSFPRRRESEGWRLRYPCVNRNPEGLSEVNLWDGTLYELG
jgi:hypothetical protein